MFPTTEQALLPRYRRAFQDWLACAYAGRNEPAAKHARSVDEGGLADQAFAVGTAGHVLDFDDTYLPGLLHLSAATGPAALVVGAARGATVLDTLEAYAVGFETMAAVSRSSYPMLYDGGWHSTAVCGGFGAAAASARLLDLDQQATTHAFRAVALRAGGIRAAFGSEGKSLQVGMAAAQGVLAARLAGAGAELPARVLEGPAGFEDAYGGVWNEPEGTLAILDNWIKAYPCCLQTHGAIEAALDAVRQGATVDGRGTVTVHPVSRQAAALDDVSTGLEAKFSIPYLTAFGILRGAPRLDDFASVDDEVRRLSRRIEVHTDPSLDESEVVLDWTVGGQLIRSRIEAALGSPQRPMDETQLAQKVHELAGDRFDGLLDDPERPIKDVRAALDFS